MKVLFITVHLNNSQSFRKTAESLKFLTNEYSWQWLIKDGLSVDSEFELVREIVRSFPPEKARLIEKKDAGIYDAMNQAIALLEDDETHCMFLNAGDTLNMDNRNDFEALFAKYSEADIVYCNHLQPGINGAKLVKAPKNLDFAYLLGKMVNHQSIFIKVKWLKKYPFNTSYKVISDWIQLFSLLKNERILIQYVNKPLVVYEGGGFSEKNNQTRLDERKQFLMSIYSEWELESLQILSRLRSRSWFPLLTKSLNSPRRSALLSLLSRII